MKTPSFIAIFFSIPFNYESKFIRYVTLLGFLALVTGWTVVRCGSASVCHHVTDELEDPPVIVSQSLKTGQNSEPSTESVTGIAIATTTEIAENKFKNPTNHHRARKSLGQSAWSATWQTFEHFIGQNSIKVLDNRASNRSMFISISIMCLMVLQLYQGYMLSMLVRPTKLPPTVTDLDELLRKLANNEVHLAVVKGESYDEVIQHSNNPFVVRIREATRNNPISKVDEIHPKRLDPKMVVLANRHVIFELMSNANVDFCRSQSVAVENGFIRLSEGIILSEQASRKYKQAIDDAIIMNYPTIQHIQNTQTRKQAIREAACHEQLMDIVNRVGKPLHMGTMAGAVCLLIVGLIISTFAFLTEYCRKKLSDKNPKEFAYSLPVFCESKVKQNEKKI